MMLFNRNWAGACWNCWAGPLNLDVGLLCKKQETKRIGRGSPVASLMPKSVLSCWKDINCLGSEFCAYLSPMGWPGIYNG